MVASDHRTHVYIGMAGEGDNIGGGGLYRRADGDEEWRSITNGLPDGMSSASIINIWCSSQNLGSLLLQAGSTAFH